MMKGTFQMKLLSLFALALVLAAPGRAFAQSEEEAAGDVSEVDKDRTGPLRDRIRPVSGHVFLKKGRFELSPSATVSFTDAFFTKYVVGGSIGYHLTESIALNLRGGYALPVIAGSAQICINDTGKGTVGCRQPTQAELDGRAQGQLSLMGGLDLQWAPIYGKLSLASEYFAHFDLYGIAGASAIQYKGFIPGQPTGSQVYTTAGANLGLGMRVFVNRYFALRGEVRDLLYFERRSSTGPNEPGQLRGQFLFELGASFFFPMGFQES